MAQVLDEPLYGHYLKLTGAPRPYRELVLKEMEQDGALRFLTAVKWPSAHTQAVFASARAHPCRAAD
jgi:hypothetical protein